MSLIPQVSELVGARLGLHFPPERWADLERGLASAAHDLGYRDAGDCARALLAAPLRRRDTEILASHLTVGETYFFREPQTLALFENHILPDLRERAETTRSLRIWSAGCCTGEEPYSIAMILDGALPDIDRWNVTILATDINPGFLRRAAEGVYGEWSFRAMRAGARERYFRRRRDGRWILDAKIRRRVKFSYLNLAADPYPSLFTDTNALDMIFCRNVMMYFSDERAREVAGNFHRALVPGGWLIVSATETSPTWFRAYEPVRSTAGTVYRKQGPEPSPIPRPSSRDPVRIPEPPRKSMVRVAPPPEDADAIAADARKLANDGRLAEAAALCRRAVQIHKLDPSLHYLLAMIQREMGSVSDSAASLKRAIYLDHDFALAHFGLANLDLLEGRFRQAEKHLRNTLEALRSRPTGDVLPESEGLAAGRLAEIVSSMLESLPGGSTR